MKKRFFKGLVVLVPLWLLLFGAAPSEAAHLLVQCPTDGDGIDMNGDGIVDNDIVCEHITGGDGFARMADGYDQYIFSFGLVPDGLAEDQIISQQTLKAHLPAPSMKVDEGQSLYLTMTNVGMIMRPDLFDPHSVHWHGFPNAAPIFDGLPEPSPTANMGSSFTYFYHGAVPGTYFYHCHVEATEHMQMGMIGNIWINPSQNHWPGGTSLNGFTHQEGYTYVYNDGDGSTYYDVDFPVQFISFDQRFHDASLTVQPLPFANMTDNYTMINGRGYPDTVNTTPGAILNVEGFEAQNLPALITATAGQKILLRLSNVSTTDLYGVATTLPVPMKVVGRGAELLRGPDGDDTSYEVSVLHVGGGQHYDVILDTTGVAPGTYFLYATHLQFLTNNKEERGGGMTEIVIQ